ncbi:MAG: DUF5723 family protein [Bacteroidales bacterium]|nr:DUF5723 family protein [Bacteroidales bacterium]
MGRIIKFFWFICIIFSPVQLMSQEMLGITSSNYAGSNANIINPSSMIVSKVFMDANLLSGDIFANSNYLYIHGNDYHPFSYLKKDPQFPEYGDDNQAFDHYYDKDMKFANTSLRMIGPSGFIVYNDHAFALQTQVRTFVSVDRAPYDIANFAYEGLDYAPQHNINFDDEDFSLAAMAWGEIDLSYAHTFYKFAHDQFSFGVTFKYLMGYSAGFLTANNLNYVVYNDSTANILNFDAQAGISLPVDYSNNDFPYGTTFKGSGFGMDLGITYVRTVKGHSNRKYKRLCAQPYSDYYYKIGVSLLDIGGITFKDNAQLHAFDNVSHYWERIDTVHFYDINYLVDDLSSRFYGDPNASLLDNQFRLGLPAAFSLQIDYHLRRNWYVNGFFIYPVNLAENSLKRPEQAAIIPRFETDAFEIAAPVSLYRLKDLRMGLSARIYYVTIGTDKLGSILGLGGDFTGMDLYFSVKFSLGKGLCARSGGTYCHNLEYKKYQRK